MSVFKDAIAVTRQAEVLVIGRTFRPDSRIVLEFADAMLHTPWFLLAGAQGLLYTLGRGAALSVVWCLILKGITFISNDASGTPLSSLIIGAMVLSGGSILFGLPSGLVARSVNDEHVSRLAAFITLKSSSELQSRALRDGVEKIDAMAQQRLSAITWVLGLLWAFLVWVASNWVFAPNVSASIRNTAASYGLGGLLAFAIFLAAFTSYREAQRKLSQTIAFAFLEANSRQF